MGEFQFIDIILFGMIAAFLVLRLRSVLGKHKDHGRTRDDPFHLDRSDQSGQSGQPGQRGQTEQDNVVQLPDQDSDQAIDAAAATADPTKPLEVGFSQIKAADSSFDGEEFMVGAHTAFEMIIQAFAEGDQEFLRGLLSAEVFENFARAIRSREDNKETLENTLIRIVKAEPIEAYMSGGEASITVKFVTEQVNVTRDADGEVVSGDANHISEVTDIWTFAHDVSQRDPNWRLSATRSLD